MADNTESVNNLVNALSVPGRVLGANIDPLLDTLRPEQTLFESYEATDTAGVVALLAVAGGVVALLLYIWSR